MLGYQQWMLLSRLASLDAQNSQLSTTLATQNSEIEQLWAVQSEPPAAIPVDDTPVRELQIALNAEIANLQQQLVAMQQEQSLASDAANLEWKLLEAEYLLGLASQELQLQGDLTSATALLEKADAALLASGSNSVFEARQAIADDLLALLEITPIDSSGIYLRIDALIDQVTAVDLVSMRDDFEEGRGVESQAATAEANVGAIDATLDFLSSIFVWREWDAAPAAMIAPGRDTLIKQNLQLELEQVQLALLLRDEELYQRSIENAIDGLTRYTAKDLALTQSLLSSLDELRQMDIEPALPSLERAMSAVNQLKASIR